MLSYISLVWLPYYVWHVSRTMLVDRIAPARACEILLMTMPDVGEPRIHGRAPARKRLTEWTVALNRMLGPLRVGDLDIHSVARQRSHQSFFLQYRLFAGTADVRFQGKVTEIIFAHEFGHAVWTRHFAVLVDGRLYQQRALGNEVAIRRRKRRALNANFAVLARIDRTMVEYTEVFADLVAIMAVGHVDAIPFAHDFFSWQQLGYGDQALCSGDLDRTRKQCLDFTTRIDPGEWQTIMAEIATKDPRFQLQEHYRVFAPVRGAIWRRHLQKLPDARRSEYLECFLEAAAAHLRERSIRFVADGRESIATINEDFMETLDRYVRERRLLE